jgi:histidinol-phosphate aminotransferase
VNITDLARPEILAMAPYVSARSSASADGVLLNANEAPVALVNDDQLATLDLNRYPAPQPETLRQRLASLYGVANEQLLVTRGSDEGIDLLLRVFCRAGQDSILETPPCFGMYRIAAQIQGASLIQVMRDSSTLALDAKALLTAIDEAAGLKLVFLTSPNNPTGDRLPGGLLKQVLRATRNRALVVLDEAYIEFCDEPSAVALLEKHPNLVLLRTLSKAWAAAGLRCGAVLADPRVIDLLKRVMAPYPLTAPAISAALAATSDSARDAQLVMLEDLRQQKDHLLATLAQHTWVEKLWPGDANFVLLRVDNGPALVAHCAQHGVKIRDFSMQPLLHNCVRITVGNRNDMQALEQALNQYGSTP